MKENHTVSCELKVSADLQKVVMLPRMDQFKACVFSKRLIVFNETICELEKNSKREETLLFCGTRPSQNAKTKTYPQHFTSTLKVLRDDKKLTLWLDKNWRFFTMLFHKVNDPKYELKYKATLLWHPTQHMVGLKKTDSKNGQAV